jgi:hypothetical protein
MPKQRLEGFVTIEATLCYASQVDPEDPGSYTRSGLEVIFRPDADKFRTVTSTDPLSSAFFRRSTYDSEATLRNDAQKWETVLHAERRMLASGLNDPMFDIHYNARSGGGTARGAVKMRYALVITIRSPRTEDLYERVAQTFAGQLEALQPLVDIPVRV